MGGDEAAHLAAPRAVAQLGADGGDRVRVEVAAERVQSLELAAAVRDERGAADERGDRGDDGVEPAFAEHDLLEALLGGDRATQERVLLVHEPCERPFGDRDERRVERHLVQREAACFGGVDGGLRHLLVAEPGAVAEPGEAVVGEARDVLTLGLRAVERHAGGEQQLAAGEELRRVRELGDVDPPHGRVEPLLAGEERRRDRRRRRGR